ncbi:MAG: hypothetical protein WC224_03820 [Sphaerochaetaceae bacterium]
MLRLRRIIGFSSRVQSFILLLIVFALALLMLQLWGTLTPQFYYVVSKALLFTLYLSLTYGALIILLALILWAGSAIFPWGALLKVLFRCLFSAVILLLISLFSTLTQTGIILTI